MCGCCEKNEKIKSANFCGSAKAQILGHYLDICGDEKKFSIFKRIYRPSFKINYCPICRKEAGRVNKEEVVQRLKFTSDEIDKDIKRFEETNNFEYIYDYNIYSTKEFIDELINAMEDKQ